MIYYKATRLDGTDFRTGTVDYAGALASGGVLNHPDPHNIAASGYFSVSVQPAETLIGGRWPCRLFIVEPVGEVVTTRDYDHKRAVSALRVVHEVEAWRALGPQGESVAEFIARIPDAAGYAARYAAGYAAWDAAWGAAGYAARYAAGYAAGYAARGAAWDAAWGAARYAAWYAAGYATRDAAGDAAGDAASVLLVRDLVTDKQFRTLTEPWKILTGEEL